MLISIGEGFEGYKIIEYKDLVFGTASSEEGPSYRQNAIKKACAMAETKGANALINMNIEIYSISNNNQEATVYANAVVVQPTDETRTPAETHKVNLEAFMPRAKSEKAELLETNGYKFVACPRCGTKYKIDVDADGNVHIKGFEDVDDIEPGLQVYCLRCGTKFTVPGSK